MKSSVSSFTRREALALTAAAGAAFLLPARAEADDLTGTGFEEACPPDPERMLMSVPVSEISLLSNGPSWTDSAAENGSKAFLDGNGNVFLDPAFKVIDVSKHNGAVDWEAVKNSGVDGAIIRLGYGAGSLSYDDTQEDEQARRNISECNRLGIPYGVYLYSYAYDADFARREALFTAELIKEYGCKLTLPIFYDLEKWEWTGHTPPSKPSTYESIVRTYCDTLASAGYKNVRVYSYRSYINNELKSDYIWERVAWAAEYNPTLKFESPYFQGCLAWQYTSTGSASGVSGYVDISAFPPFSKLAFGDVTSKTDHHDDIWWLAENGISTGFSDGTFRGLSSVARQDMAAFLYRIAGSPAFEPSEEDAARFSDVNSGTPHYKEILWLGHTGVSTGFSDGTFRGLRSVARQDMAAFLRRVKNLL